MTGILHGPWVARPPTLPGGSRARKWSDRDLSSQGPGQQEHRHTGRMVSSEVPPLAAEECKLRLRAEA